MYSFLRLRRLLLGSFFLLSISSQSIDSAEFSEAQVKAVYLINFAEFIRWADNAFTEDPKAFCFCALQAESPVISVLRKVITNEYAKERKLIFKQINTEEELKYCQVFYFTSDDQSRFAEFLPQLKQKSILTVSDTDEFVEKGGMITISRKKRRLHPTINLKNLEKTGLKVSAKLLRLATIVNNK